MYTVRMKNADIESLLRFLKSHFGRHGAKEWENQDSVIGIFHHQQFLSSSFSTHLLSIVFEFSKVSKDAICNIYAGGSSSKFSDTDAVDELEEHVGNMIRSQHKYDADVMGNRRYCTQCRRWDTYDIKQGQYSVFCNRCGLEISLEEN